MANIGETTLLINCLSTLDHGMVNINSELCIRELNVKQNLQLYHQAHILSPVKKFAFILCCDTDYILSLEQSNTIFPLIKCHLFCNIDTTTITREEETQMISHQHLQQCPLCKTSPSLCIHQTVFLNVINSIIRRHTRRQNAFCTMTRVIVRQEVVVPLSLSVSNKSLCLIRHTCQQCIRNYWPCQNGETVIQQNSFKHVV